MKPLVEQNLYELLEVAPDAPETEIVRAWERIEALYGPGSLATYTLISPDEAEILGRRLEEALFILLNPAARKAYDARLGSMEVMTVSSRPEGFSTSTSGRSVRLPPIIPPLPTPVPSSTVPRLLTSLSSTAPVISPTARTSAMVNTTEGAETMPLASSGSVAKEPTVVLTVSGEVVDPPRLEAVPVDPTPLESENAPPRLSPPAPIPLSTVASLPSVAPEGAGEVRSPRPPELPRMRELRKVAPSAPLRAVAAAPIEEPITDATRFSGDVLRRARETRGISIQQMCERTKITRHHLENVESDRYDKLPVPVYLRGILMAIAKELRLDGQKVARSYLDARASAPPPAVDSKKSR